MKFSVLIGVKHFIHMIMMTNLAIHTIVASLQTAVSHLTKVPTKSKSKNTAIKEKEENSKCKIQNIKERTINLDINKIGIVYNPKQLPKIQSNFSSAFTRERKGKVFCSDRNLRNLQTLCQRYLN